MRRSIQLLTVFAALLVAACSDGGTGGPGGGGNGGGATEPLLGLTSVQKVGATAISNPAAAAKPSFASGFGKGINRLFSAGIANAQTACPASAPTSFDVSGGKIWIDEAYAILDEVEFEAEPSTDSPEVGPFALDLTNSDPNVGQAIQVNVPAGDYSGMKFRIKRVEDEAMPILNVSAGNEQAFRDKLVRSSTKRRPSIYIAGTIEVTGVSCKEFIFIADGRWEVRIPFRSGSAGGSAGGSAVDAVLLFDLAAGFKSGMAASGATAQSLTGEVGAGPQDPMGPQFLDGRTKDPNHGTPIAEAITAALPKNMKIFLQPSGAMDDKFPGTTLVEDNAKRVSDDNLSISDLDKNGTSG